MFSYQLITFMEKYCSDQNVKSNNNQSCAKNMHGFIDINLGEKIDFYDKAQQKILFRREAHIKLRIGVKNWRQYSKVNTKNIAKVVKDREIAAKIEGKNKKHKKIKTD